MGFRFNNANGGSAQQLWKFQSVAPITEIMLNDTAGVTGIRAPLPQDADLEFTFREVVPGNLIGGVGVYETPTKIMYAGATKNTKDRAAVLNAQDIVTGATAVIYSNFDSLGRPVSGFYVTDSGEVVSLRASIEPGQISYDAINTATNDITKEQQTTDAKEFTIYIAGVATYRLRYDPQGFALYNGVGANDLIFQITENGQILTNQTESATANDTTIIGRFPVHDEAGILIGYAPLMVDP